MNSEEVRCLVDETAASATDWHILAIEAMKERIDESWRRYLWNLLCDPVGVNLRNRVARTASSRRLTRRRPPSLSMLPVI